MSRAALWLADIGSFGGACTLVYLVWYAYDTGMFLPIG